MKRIWREAVEGGWHTVVCLLATATIGATLALGV